MLIQTSRSKESSYDGKGSVGDKPEPSPERGDVANISANGVEPSPEQAIATQSMPEQRDRER